MAKKIAAKAKVNENEDAPKDEETIEINERIASMELALAMKCPTCGAIAKDAENIPGTLLYVPSGYMCSCEFHYDQVSVNSYQIAKEKLA